MVGTRSSSHAPTGMPTAMPAPSPMIGRQRISCRDRQLTSTSAGRFTSSTITTGSRRSGKTSARAPTVISPEPKPKSTYTSWATTSTAQVRA